MKYDKLIYLETNNFEDRYGKYYYDGKEAGIGYNCVKTLNVYNITNIGITLVIQDNDINRVYLAKKNCDEGSKGDRKQIYQIII